MQYYTSLLTAQKGLANAFVQITGIVENVEIEACCLASALNEDTGHCAEFEEARLGLNQGWETAISKKWNPGRA
jgi:hypothetical protein